MKVSEIKIGETYNGVKVLEKFREKAHTKYWCICPVCGKRFSMKAETVGIARQCKECNAKSRIIDISGQRFGRLVAIEHAGRVVNRSGFRTTLWKCKCDCGKETIVRYPLLVSGNTRSCGCLERENKERIMKLAQQVNRKSVSANFAGKLENHPLYKTWKSMLMRCNNPKVRGYKHYGGRGIKVCDRWSGDLGFENFVNDMGERTNGTTLDRVDVNGNYEPSNCRWATTEQQMNNRTDNSRIILNGESITCAQLCKRYGFYYTWVAHQLRAGIDINFIIKKQLRPKEERIGHAGRRAYSKDYGNHNRVVSDEVAALLESKLTNQNN